jgi:hypothetical protein
MPLISGIFRERATGIQTAGMSTRAVAGEMNVHFSIISHLQLCFGEFVSTSNRPQPQTTCNTGSTGPPHLAYSSGVWGGLTLNGLISIHELYLSKIVACCYRTKVSNVNLLLRNIESSDYDHISFCSCNDLFSFSGDGGQHVSDCTMFSECSVPLHMVD